MSDDLVSLARELVDLDARASEVRTKMRALLDGPPAPTRPLKPVAGLNGGGQTRAAQRAQTEADDLAIVDLLKTSPSLRLTEIIAALQKPASTVQLMLKRLARQSLIERDKDRRWSATSSSRSETTEASGGQPLAAG